MSKWYPKNFDPAKYLGVDGSTPEEGSDDTWSIWCAGDEPKIPPEFALFCWWHFADALSTFVQWRGLQNAYPPEYLGGGDLADARFQKELTPIFEAIGNSVGEAWAAQPFRLESATISESFNAVHEGRQELEILVKAHCAYSVKCLDDGISGIFENNPIKAASGFSFSIRALELAHEYIDFWGTKRLEEERLDRSRTGKAGAQVRWAPYKKLEAWAVEKYRAKKWPSANKAAHALKDQVMEYGRTIDAHLTEENAQSTIAGWFRKANKSV